MRTSLYLLYVDLVLCGRIVAFFAAFAMIITVLVCLAMMLRPAPSYAAASVPYLINFQGRLSDNSGNIFPNGSYNVKFRIMDASSGGTILWEGDRIYGGSDHRIAVQNGLFNIQFGDSAMGDPALDPALFNNQVHPTLYLEVELPSPATVSCASNGCAIWTEGAMTPRQPFASATYAFNSDTLDGLDSSEFVQLGAVQTGSIHVSGTIQSDGSLQGSTASLSGTASLSLGTAGSAPGQVSFYNGSNSNVTILQSGATGPPSLTLTLPSATGSSGDCLKDTSGTGILGFAACGTGTTLQMVYDNSSGPATITTSSSTKALIIKSGPSNNSTTAFAVTPDGTSTPTLNVDTANSRVGIGTATPTEALDVDGGVRLGTTTGTNAGTIRFNGADFQGYNGSAWVPLNAAATNVIANQMTQVIKPADQSVSSSTAFVDDDDLTFTIGPNESWSFQMNLLAFSGTSPDLKFSISAPAGASCSWGVLEAENSTSAGSLGCGASSGSISGSGADEPYLLYGTVATGVTGGSVTLRWAQNTSNAAATIVRGGSYMLALQQSGGSLNPFVQGGNSYGATAVIGTADANDVSVVAGGTEAMHISTSGNITAAADLGVAGSLNVGAGEQYQIGGVQISSAALSNDAALTKQGNTFNGASQLVQTTGAGDLPAISGANLTSLNASALAAGTGAVTLQSGGAAALTLTSASGAISLGSGILQRAGPALTLDLATGSTSQLSVTNSNGANVANLSVSGGLIIGAGQAVTVGATPGATTTCAGGQVLGDQTVAGGITTGGTCTGFLAVNATGPAVVVNAAGAPTDDQLLVDNTAVGGVTTGDANGIHIKYKGGNAAVEAAGMRIDSAPGGTSGGVWSGLRIVAGGTGPAAGVTEYGVKLEGPTAPGAGSTTGIKLTTGWDIGVAIESGGLELGAQDNPALPAANHLRVFAKKIAGRTMLKVMGSSGVDYPLQPSLFQNQVSIINAQSGTANNYFGTNRTLTGTASTPAATEDYGYMTNFATAATSGSDAGISNNATQFFRGSQVGANGFFFNLRAALPDSSPSTNGARLFAGMTDRTTTQSVSSDNPSGHRAGFSYSTIRGDTHWQFSTRDGSTEDLTDTGMVFADNKAYDFYIYTPPYPNNTTIFWRIDNLSDGTSQEGTATTNLPGGSTALRGSWGIETESAAASNIRMQRLYIEADR